MKGYFVKLLIVGCFFGMVSMAEAQQMEEAEVPFEILKWHFNHYPNSESQSWQNLNDHALVAEFTFKEGSYRTVYLMDGKRLSEEMDMTKNIPLSIQYYLDDKYGKYKVQNFTKVTNFSEEQTYYTMGLKTKANPEEKLSFDEHLIPIDFALISSID